MRSPHVTVQPETGQAVVAIVPRERCRPDVVLQKKVHTTGKGVGLVVSVLQQMIGVARGDDRVVKRVHPERSTPCLQRHPFINRVEVPGAASNDIERINWVPQHVQ